MLHRTMDDLRNAAALAAVLPGLAASALAQNGAALASDPPALVRLTPAEYMALPAIADRAGPPGLASRILKGDPSKLGLYTILLKVPAHTRIDAHTHPDERVATVVSGSWYVGYGDRFDPNALKELPPGSFYSEPAAVPHFARTGDTPAVVQITGVGPTGTEYTNPAQRRFDSTR